jgi:hypothetical protein
MVKKYKQTRKTKTKTKRKQKGGFYPSVYGGVSTASLLAVAGIRQGYRLWSNRKQRKTRRQRKH